MCRTKIAGVPAQAGGYRPAPMRKKSGMAIWKIAFGKRFRTTPVGDCDHGTVPRLDVIV
jgi:hypothetical protein